MRTFVEFEQQMRPYKGVEYIYDPVVGRIAWRTATGGNLEVLFVEAVETGKGLGHELYRRMVAQLVAQEREPHHSVIGFRLAGNKLAERFYAKLGFFQFDLGQSVYSGDGTVVMWCEWQGLRRVLGV